MSFDNRWALRKVRGRVHLTLNLGGKRIAYAYIRKNACSAFKQALGFHPSEQIDTVAQGHRYDGGACDAAIFVWRDPVDRLLSLYKSKIIERRGAVGMIQACEKILGHIPSDFDEFVDFAIQMPDPHCWTQYSHLRRLNYTHAIPMDSLHDVMVSLVGEDEAAIFKSPVNASSEIQVEVSDASRQKIASCYAEDYRMIRRVK